MHAKHFFVAIVAGSFLVMAKADCFGNCDEKYATATANCNNFSDSTAKFICTKKATDAYGNCKKACGAK